MEFTEGAAEALAAALAEDCDRDFLETQHALWAMDGTPESDAQCRVWQRAMAIQDEAVAVSS